MLMRKEKNDILIIASTIRKWLAGYKRLDECNYHKKLHQLQ